MKSLLFVPLLVLGAAALLADGLVVAPAPYKGSLEERAQEAVIVFTPGRGKQSATEDLILKIRVEGDPGHFAWVVPFPNPPKTAKEDPKLFEELHRYVQKRTTRSRVVPSKGAAGETLDAKDDSVRVISRKVVGTYDVAVVREEEQGALNGWLAKEGFKPIENGEDVIEWYRGKGYVFSCIKVREVKLAEGVKDADLHPLRFTFETGGRDGIYFPMRLTGLQKKPFDVNLYVFYGAWLNDALDRHGFEHRGFRLVHRDWDTPKCRPNAGKTWSNPRGDPYLRDLSGTIPTVTAYFQKRHPGRRFYLTNLQAYGLKPGNVRDWTNDLWMFPYYLDRKFVPYDARDGGPAVP
ncbi:MAG: DUF2330 domain-containing protein [Akkermansiaceae bacterium]|nr:DUF2330 domain-containing protein [Akkermansiaceae bacterium]